MSAGSPRGPSFVLSWGVGLFNRKKPPPRAGTGLAKRPKSAAPVHVGDDAVDTLAQLLRTYGQHAFDVADTSANDVLQRCEELARSVSVASDNDGDGLRDFAGARAFFNEQRREESQWVERTLGDFRDVVLTFVQGLKRAAREDRVTDEGVGEQLVRLQSAAQGNDTDALKREALNAVGVIGQLLQSRRVAQRDQLRDLGRKLNAVGEQLREAESQLELDALTQLYNRAGLDKQLLRAVDMADLFEQYTSLVMLDIDHFKAINDDYGHQAGDHVLREIGKRCLRCFPGKSEFVARYGGEEIAILIPQVEVEKAAADARHLLEVIAERPMEHGGERFFVTASAGVARIQPGEGAAAWVGRADKALYEAKATGRDRVVVADCTPKLTAGVVVE